MHWFWRAVFSIAIVTLSAVPFLYYLDWWVLVLIKRTRYLLGQRTGVYALVVFIPMISTLAVYGLLTRWLGPEPQDNETRCRKCRYILRGVPEPRCPECGEII